MTMPSIPARERHAHRVNGKFAKRPATQIGRIPRTPDGLSDDAWRESSAKIARAYPQYHAEYEQALEMQRKQETAMPTPPQPWRDVHIDDDGRLRLGESEPVERETWTDWRAVGLVLFVIAALAAAVWKSWA